MKAKVINAFCDTADGDRTYLPGNDFEAGEARVAELEAKGFVRRAEAKAEEAAKPAAKAAPRRATRKAAQKKPAEE